MRHYLIAIGVGVGVAIVAGFAWALIWQAIPFLSLLTAAGIGYAIGELISRATNRKRGHGLQIIAGVSVLISFATNYLFAVYFLSVSWFSLYTIIGLALGIFIAITRLR
jgi:hypothetical protein